MNNFKDFGIKAESQIFTGDKIKITRIFNREIKVLDYRIVDSKYKDKGKCLHIQIELDGIKHVVFTGSSVLMEMIEQVPKMKFPFTTTIIKENERFEFS